MLAIARRIRSMILEKQINLPYASGCISVDNNLIKVCPWQFSTGQPRCPGKENCSFKRMCKHGTHSDEEWRSNWRSQSTQRQHWHLYIHNVDLEYREARKEETFFYAFDKARSDDNYLWLGRSTERPMLSERLRSFRDFRVFHHSLQTEKNLQHSWKPMSGRNY